VDTWTAGGNYIYVVGHSSGISGPSGHGILIKYDSTGAKLASATLVGVGGMGVAITGNDTDGSDVYVTGQRDTPSANVTYRFDDPDGDEEAGTEVRWYRNGAAVGAGSLIDFRNLIYSVIKLNNGGVCINFGSAILLPEVFLKALNVSRNLGHKVKNFTTANFDMITQYRPIQNVVKRPTLEGGRGYNIIGHHEIMIPLLYQSIIEGL